MAKKGKPQKRNWISSNSSTKQRHNDYVKARIDKMQQNSRCRLCGDKDETINHIISKLAQKEYRTRHEWVGEVIHWELCKKFKSDYTNKWYMHNTGSVLENEIHKILCDFVIQRNHLILAKWPKQVIVKKKRKIRKENLLISSGRSQGKTEGKWKER